MQAPYSSRTQWYVVLLLTMAATLSFIDRQILNVMIGPIKRDLGGLSDTEISLIIGLAFSLVFTLATVPLARMADHANRRNIIAAGIFAWSLATALAGKADSFRNLFLARMGVGIGEAALGPASTSLLADYFDNARLRWPMASSARRRSSARAWPTSSAGRSSIGWRRGPTSRCRCLANSTHGRWCWSVSGCRAFFWRR
ncbi:MAG: MFS transporter [Gammaproteobacteria bacterium]|nr:MFS transporter [Gammaproteobacteria bacterium]